MIAAANSVHRELGPGLLESADETCLCHELRSMGIPFERQVRLPVRYKGIELDCGDRIDLLIADVIVLEIKAVEGLIALHTAQVLTYRKLSGKPLGLLMNFNVPALKDGIRRIVLSGETAQT